jgi:hypothetical protein
MQFKSPESFFPTRYCESVHVLKSEQTRFVDMVAAADSYCWPVVQEVRFVHAGGAVGVAGVDWY